MPETVVITDTSCLIALSKTNVLDILPKLYSRVVVTEEIAAEFGEPLPLWLEVMPVADKKYLQLLEHTLDKGEASAIALAISLGDVLLIMDDLKGRKEAKRLGFKITGTLGVLFSAKQKGLLPALKPLIDQLYAVDFRISPHIVKELLTLSGEM
jgi:predicted nucleic acid-binding protein